MTEISPRIIVPVVVIASMFVADSQVNAEDQKAPATLPSAKSESAQANDGGDLTPLNKSKTVLIDLKGKRVLIKGEVVLREGLLEMLVCLKQTKEHESLVSVDCKAQVVHAGLIALGTEVGSVAKFNPEYQPATGQTVHVFMTWTDAEGKIHRDPAQSWVRHATRRYFIEKLDPPPKGFNVPADSDLKWDSKHLELLWYGPMTNEQRDQFLKLNVDTAYQKAIRSIHRQSQVRQMDARWVFSGSGFTTDENTGEKYYLAEGGDLICIANFATATLDLAIESSAVNDTLMFEAYTERIPPVGTKVTIELVPDFGAKDTKESVKSKDSKK